MLITIVYISGCIEDFSTPPLGTSFGGGCVIDNAFLHVDDMQNKGIRLSTSYVGTHSQATEDVLMNEKLIAEPEILDHIYKVYKDNREIMGQDETGHLLNPVEYEVFLQSHINDE